MTACALCAIFGGTKERRGWISTLRYSRNTWLLFWLTPARWKYFADREHAGTAETLPFQAAPFFGVNPNRGRFGTKEKGLAILLVSP